MFDSARHETVVAAPWSTSAAKSAIDAIVAEALARFDPVEFWPAHPQDDNVRDGTSSIYFGAGGMICGLDYLDRVGATKRGYDFAPILPHLLAQTRADMKRIGAYGKLGSLLFGELGTGLVAMRIAPTDALADMIAKRVASNDAVPVRELMWGTPGSMLACLEMHAITRAARWQSMYKLQAARLLNDLVDTPTGPMWTQNLYGKRVRYLGLVHGFAGNIAALLRGWAWLTKSQRARVELATTQMLAAEAVSTDGRTNWSARAGKEKAPTLCQICHGAPGVITAFADAAFSTQDFEQLLVGGGELIWQAGPLIKGSNLCHGTGGNGYALLKLYRRTRKKLWLDRARVFAMASIAQCEAARNQHGRGRFTLWTGDVGLAIYLHDCMTGEPNFPTVDAF